MTSQYVGLLVSVLENGEMYQLKFPPYRGFTGYQFHPQNKWIIAAAAAIRICRSEKSRVRCRLLFIWRVAAALVTRHSYPPSAPLSSFSSSSYARAGWLAGSLFWLTYVTLLRDVNNKRRFQEQGDKKDKKRRIKERLNRYWIERQQQQQQMFQRQIFDRVI